MPSKNNQCDYFTGERQILIDRKEFGNLDSQLLAALHNMKLLHYGIEKKVNREIEVPKPQVILTSAQAGFENDVFCRLSCPFQPFTYRKPFSASDR